MKGGGMSDRMLTELYRRVFETKAEAESLNKTGSDDRMRQVAIAKNKLLSELIDFRTEQIKEGGG